MISLLVHFKYPVAGLVGALGVGSLAIAFGDFSLNFEVVYYVLTPDYAAYMDIQQGINLGIHRRFEEAGIRFAYPTQDVLLRRAPMPASAVTGAAAGQHGAG